ncbi:NAD(P)(+)--arginine ADP-ribosyltransferase 2-like [Pygocentrus nattereri]|uniref:NAD(P)(+)--arginine ADP-ribosyltransferase 2-like n=1 Tax=Pygocentrus nattereri TaxID=42514 RepID=UPI0018919BD6|nr:NAD(P)(+)--arginine ADP-ribosyltransferase 2-like [Pygocentrus nattereri]
MKMLQAAAMKRIFLLIILLQMGPVVRSASMYTCPNCMMGQQASWQINQVPVPGNEIFMDESLKSIDDQFMGCKENMYRLVMSKLLKPELDNNEKFRKAWQETKAHFGLNGVPESKLKKDQLRRIALHVYTRDEVYGQLNGKMRSGRDDYKTEKFGLISLHFLITDAIQVLKPVNCQTAYRFSQDNFAIPGTFMRFGSFASSTRKSTLSSFGKKTCFIITTCFGAHISQVSKYASEDEVLIPPYERFKKIPPPFNIPQSLADCGRIHTLTSAGVKSKMNCELFKQ